MPTDYLNLATGKYATQPEFAKEDTIDPTSGKNNVRAPEAAQKSYGWIPFGMRPERNVMNWLHRHTYGCLKWCMDTLYPAVDNALYDIDQRVNQLEPNIRRYGGSLNAALFLVRDDSEPTYGWQAGSPESEGTPRVTDRRYLDFTLNWEIFHNLFILKIPELYNTVNLITHTQTILWIVDPIPQLWKDKVKNLQRMQCLVYNPPGATMNGHITIDKETWDEVSTLNILSVDPTDPCTNNWHNYIIAGASTGMAGMPAQVIMGWCDVP